MDDDSIEAYGAARLEPQRPWTSDAASIVRDIQQRIKRPNVPARKSVALHRARQIQLAKMAKLNDDLRQEVKFAAAEARQSVVSMKLGLDCAQNLSELIQSQQARRDALDAELAACQARLSRLKLEQGSDIIQIARDRKAQAAIQRLESRLQRSLLKQNAMHATNEAFKQQQEAMRRDLAIADSVQVGLGQQLADIQRRICSVTAAYDDAVQHNDRSQETLGALQHAAEQWHGTFQADWAAMARLMSEQTHARSATTRNRQVRITLPDKDTSQNANPLLRRQAGADLERTSTLKATATTKASLDRYTTMFAAITAATGIDDVELLIQTFREQARFRNDACWRCADPAAGT